MCMYMSLARYALHVDVADTATDIAMIGGDCDMLGNMKVTT